MRTRVARLAIALLALLAPSIALRADPQIHLFGPTPGNVKLAAPGTVQHAIVIDIDGLRRDSLYGLLATEPGNIPNISSIVGSVTYDSQEDAYEFQNAAGVNRATTMLPSVTLPSQLAILTGLWPKHHGIPANAWFSRTLGQPIVAEALLEQLLGGIIPGKEAQTLLQLAGDQGYSAALCFDPSAYEADVRGAAGKLSLDPVALDALMTTAVLQLVNDTGIPRILLVYYPGNDINSHANGAQTQQDYLKDTLDGFIGKLLHGEAAKPQVEPLPGLLDLDPDLFSHTLFVFCADHGHINIQPDEAHTISSVKLNSALSGVGYTIGQNAAYLPNGGAGLLYLKNRRSDRWTRPRAYADVLPAARALAGSKVAHGGSLDFLLVRVNDSPDGAAYRVFDLDAGRVRSLLSFFFTRRLHGRVYPDAVSRILGTDPAKLGDIIIFPNRAEGYECAEAPGFVSDHGSLGAIESYVPMIFARGGTLPRTLPRARNIDIAPTVAEALGLWLAWSRTDGQPLPINSGP